MILPAIKDSLLAGGDGDLVVVEGILTVGGGGRNIWGDYENKLMAAPHHYSLPSPPQTLQAANSPHPCRQHPLPTLNRGGDLEIPPTKFVSGPPPEEGCIPTNAGGGGW